MTTEQNKLADKIEQVPVGPFAILLGLNDGTHFKDVVAARGMIVAALRAAGEPVAYKCQRCGYNRDQHAGVDVAHCGEFVDAAQPAPSASVRTKENDDAV